MLVQNNHHVLTPEFVAKGFMELVEDESKNGAVMRVTPQKGIDYVNYQPKSKSKL